MRPVMILLILLSYSAVQVTAQDAPTAVDKVFQFPSKLIERVNKKASKMEDDIVTYSEKAIRRLERQEEKLKAKLSKKDSLEAEKVFGDVKGRYAKLRDGLTQQQQVASRYKQYIPGFDTLKTSLNFLSQNAQSFVSNNAQLQELSKAVGAVKGLDEKLQSAEAIKAYIRERRQQLRGQLENLGMLKELQKYNKEVYYYAQQIKEYKQILNDPERLQRKALSMLQKIPAVREFFDKYSDLANLFRVPDDYGSMASLVGLQTRSSIQSAIQQRVMQAGAGGQNTMQANMQQLQQQVNAMKEQFRNAGNLGSDDEIPDFKPNSQKTKTFWKRLEYGTNLQNSRSSTFLPTTTDFGLSVGYKINDRSIAGVGASYKMGWGKDIRNVTISHQGVGLRSFIDWKIKGSFYLSGGYEQNYTTQFDNVRQLRSTPSNWTHSGLLGLNKKYSIGKKWKGELKLLYDFLYRSHSPQTQPVLFRMGYTF